jgi:phosphoribosyl-ATP pyrophosphohydrolase/phosphoribosyl-AMP cyclohydrolase
MTLAELKYDERGLLTIVAQDRLTGELRMLAHANREALQATLDTGEAHFYSRSRASLWKKGESSGHLLRVSEVWTDCDGDAVLYLVEPAGPTCHTGRATCFFRVIGKDGMVADNAITHGMSALPRLWAELEARKASGAANSYTRKLLDGGAPAINAKITEEAGELAHAITGESDQAVVSEAADVLYHVLVGLLSRGVSMRDVEAELAKRFGVSGLDEKAGRAPKS